MEQTAAETMTLGLRVSDVSGQKTVKASAVPAYSTVGELIQALLTKMGLARNDAEGRPLAYRARLERENRHLAGSEVVGDALMPEDHIVLQPDIQAGGARG